MGSTKFIVLINILIISYAQITPYQYNLNHQRKLELDLNETILIGFDNYTEERKDKTTNLNFNTYYMMKSNITCDKFNTNEIFKNSFNISSKIYSNSTKFENKDFICYIDSNSNFKYKIKDNTNYDYFVIYTCKTTLNSIFHPKKINLTTNLSEIDFISNYVKKKEVSPFALAMQSELIKLKNIIIFHISECYFSDCCSFKFLKEAKIIQSNRDYFKIRGRIPDICEQNNNDISGEFESQNIRLIVMNNDRPAEVQCKGYCDKSKENDLYYYYLETTSINPEINSSLQYAIANFTTKNKTIMLDFDNYNNSWIYKSQNLFKKATGGLSTGGIIAIVIPCFLILLGVSILTYLVTKKSRPIPSPHMKNMENNNTIGVASSEAVVPK